MSVVDTCAGQGRSPDQWGKIPAKKCCIPYCISGDGHWARNTQHCSCCLGSGGFYLDSVSEEVGHKLGIARAIRTVILGHLVICGAIVAVQFYSELHSYLVGRDRESILYCNVQITCHLWADDHLSLSILSNDNSFKHSVVWGDANTQRVSPYPFCLPSTR